MALSINSVNSVVSVWCALCVAVCRFPPPLMANVFCCHTLVIKCTFNGSHRQCTFKIITQAGGASPCNFWTSTIKRIFSFIIGILRLRAIDWYINEFNPRRSGGGGGSGGFRLFGTPPPEFYWGIFPKLYLYIWNPQLKPVDWHPF